MSVSSPIPWDDKELAGLILCIALYYDPDGASAWLTHKNWDLGTALVLQFTILCFTHENW